MEKKQIKQNSSKDILRWIAENFSPIERIEQAGCGYTYCEIINKCHPCSINMGKVKNITDSNNSNMHDHILKNYKLLQEAFIKNSINKQFDMTKLSKGKFQDNLEFLQWMRFYFNKIHPSNLPDGIDDFQNSISAEQSKISQKSYHSHNQIRPKKLLKKLPTPEFSISNKASSKENVKIDKIVFKHEYKSERKKDIIDSLTDKYTYSERKNNPEFNLNTNRSISSVEKNRLKSEEKDWKSRLSKKGINLSRKKEALTINKDNEVSKDRLIEKNEESLMIIKEYENEIFRLREENKTLSDIILGQDTEIEKHQVNLTGLTKVVGVIQKERDFYYSKLRDIEMLMSIDKLEKKYIHDILSSKKDIEIIAYKPEGKEEIEVELKYIN